MAIYNTAHITSARSKKVTAKCCQSNNIHIHIHVSYEIRFSPKLMKLCFPSYWNSVLPNFSQIAVYSMISLCLC